MVPASALSIAASAVSQVVGVRPDVLRADTPLRGVGCDDVATLAVVDLLVTAGHVSGDIGEAVRSATTVGDISAMVAGAVPAGGNPADATRG